jgi:putative transposase
MPKTSPAVHLTAEARDVLAQVVAHGTKSARAIHRARILLLLGEGRSEQDLATIVGVSRGTIYNVRTKSLHKEYEPILEVLHEAPRSGRPRKIDTRVEANVAMIACSDPPEGYGRWTLRMIADKLVRVKVVDSLSHASVSRTLEKTNCSRGSANHGA